MEKHHSTSRAASAMIPKERVQIIFKCNVCAAIGLLPGLLSQSFWVESELDS